MFKKIFTLLLFIAFLTCGCANKKEVVDDDLTQIIKRDKLVVGVRQDTPPFGYKNKKGDIVGYDIDLAKIFAKSLLGDENKLELIPVTASDRIRILNSQQVDILVATMSITPQRQHILHFSVPYYIAGQAILVKNSSKATSLSDFEGEKLIIVYGSTSERDLRTNVPGVKLIGYKTYNEAVEALKSGKAEGIVADDTILLGYAYNDSSIKLLPKRYSKEPYAVAFRSETDSRLLIEKIDYIIKELQGSGQLNKLQEKWEIKD